VVSLKFEPGDESERCGMTPGKKGKRLQCELPPDHVVGRDSGTPYRERKHVGRDVMGRWRTWE
jgi:hypothetical protein